MTSVCLKELAHFHYGSALKADERDADGPYDVFGSNGPVGKHSERLVNYPTIVVGRKGSVGSIHYAPHGGWPIDTAYYTEIIDKKRVHLRYLFYALNHAGLDRHTIVTSIPGLNRDTLYRTEIPIPFPDDFDKSISEQRRIADILDRADEIRRKRREVATRIDGLVPSIFCKMFGDPIQNPKEWPVAKLGEVAVLDRGRSRHRPRDAAFLYGGNYPLVQTGDITNANGYVRKYSQTYSEDGLAQSKLWPAGTLCITIAANIAKTAVLTFDACFPDSVVGLIPKEKLTTEYVRQWFVAMEKTIDAAATQVAQKNINLQILRDLCIQLPPIELQREFTNMVNLTRQLHETATDTINKAEDLFNSLVQRAFKGEL
jgi:type I restriction enzyme S subunit